MVALEGTSLIRSSAVISRCGKYRYVLRREWDDALPAVLFIGLNPSTADATQDDPTIRRCICFAREWGFGSLWMANLFAWRATDPKKLSCVTDPVGWRNEYWLRSLCAQANTIVAAWGNGGNRLRRGERFVKRYANLKCLGQTDRGHPRHPLYVRKSQRPVDFKFEQHAEP